MVRIDGIGDAAFNFDAQDVGEEEFLTADFFFLTDGQYGCKHRGRRVRQQTVDTLFGSR